MRRLTPRQFKELRRLIGDAHRRALYGTGDSLHCGDNGSLIWTPPGPDKYVLTEDAHSDKRTILRLPNIGASGAASLFSESGETA